MKIIPVNKPEINSEDIKYINDCIRSGWVSSSGKYINLFEKNFKNVVKRKYAVAVSGGPDSLALAYLSKCFSIIYNARIYYYIVDHGLRQESSKEAKKVVSILKKFMINCKILVWKGNKPKSNIQSIARNNRYSLLIKECKKNNIKHILLGHHADDQYENFLLTKLRQKYGFYNICIKLKYNL